MSTLGMDDQASLNMQATLRALMRDESASAVLPDSAGSLPTEYLGFDNLSIAIVGPNDRQREEVTLALSRCGGNKVRAYSSYPPSLDYLPMLLEQQHDVLIIELDSDPEHALDLVEAIGANGSVTVIVYSVSTDPEMLMRCMRAGTREFLTLPFQPGVIEEFLVRAAARRRVVHPSDQKTKKKKTGGRLLAFMGAKGGTGVTTLACGFAVALAQEARETTLLIDLDLPLGDAALNLGIISEYSTITALQAAERLDSSLLSGFLVKHDSGVSVLAAPGKLEEFHADSTAIDKLLTVARQEFDNVVVDLGSKFDMSVSGLFKEPCTVYLVTQAGIPELRNSNRLISKFFGLDGPKLEVVINRYEVRRLGVLDEHINKALTRPARWKVPNDYASVKRMQIDAAPLALADSPVSREIRRMARSVSGSPAPEVNGSPAKKKGFSFFS